MKNLLLLLLVVVSAGFAAKAAEKLEIYTEEFVPFNYLEKKGDSSVITGFCYDVVKELQKKVGDDSPIKNVIWSTGYEKVKSTPNTALFSMGRNPLREKDFRFIGPIADNAYLFFVKDGSKIDLKELEDARPYRIGVYKDDATEQFLRIQGFNNLVVADTAEENFKNLMDGRVDMWITSQMNAHLVAAKFATKPDAIRGIFVAFTSGLYIGFNKDTDTATVDAWEKALQTIREDGTFEKIRTRWVEKVKKGIRLEDIK